MPIQPWSLPKITAAHEAWNCALGSRGPGGSSDSSSEISNLRSPTVPGSGVKGHRFCLSEQRSAGSKAQGGSNPGGAGRSQQGGASPTQARSFLQTALGAQSLCVEKPLTQPPTVKPSVTFSFHFDLAPRSPAWPGCPRSSASSILTPRPSVPFCLLQCPLRVVMTIPAEELLLEREQRRNRKALVEARPGGSQGGLGMSMCRRCLS